MDTNTHHWRERGNAHYKSALQDSDLMSRYDGLLMAFNCYNSAVGYADDKNEESSALKNLAMSAWKLATTGESLGEKEVPVTRRQYHLYEGVKHFDRALKLGQKLKPDSWCKELEDKYTACAQQLLLQLSSLPSAERIQHIEKLIGDAEMANEGFKSHCYLEVAKVLFHQSIKPLETKDFKSALYYLAEVYRPLEESRRLSLDNDWIVQELKTLEDDVFLHRCTAESLQALKTGDDTFKKFIDEEDDPAKIMEMTFVVMDWYKKAILLSKEREVEVEAIALSRLGNIYDSVLQMEVKAKEYFMQCMQLANSLHPRTFNSEEWYKICRNALARYQGKVRRESELAEQRIREECRKELAKELAQLEKHRDNNDVNFLRFLYKTFKPQREDHTLNAGSLQGLKKNSEKRREAVKKLLQKAIIHYHPDKARQYGKKIEVLHLEITQRLTPRYEQTKGGYTG